MGPANPVCAICGLNDIPTRRVMGVHLMVVDEDGNQQSWFIAICALKQEGAWPISTNDRMTASL